MKIISQWDSNLFERSVRIILIDLTVQKVHRDMNHVSTWYTQLKLYNSVIKWKRQYRYRFEADCLLHRTKSSAPQYLYE